MFYMSKPARSMDITHIHARTPSDSLSGFGADQDPEWPAAVEALPEETLHFLEGPEEEQVPVDGEQFPPHLQTGHLQREQREGEG